MFSYLISFLIGYLLAHNFIQIFIFIFLLINTHLFNMNLVYLQIFLLLIYLTGGIIGIQSYQKQDTKFEIWKPRKDKLIISLGIGVTYTFIIALFINEPGFSTSIISLVASTIIAYPFSALLYYYCVNYKKLEGNIKWILMLIIINPIFTVVIGSLNSLVLNR